MKKKIILNTGLLAVLGTPITMAISCGSVAAGVTPDQESIGGNPFDVPFVGTGNSFDWGQDTTDGVLSTSAYTPDNQPPEYWGYDTQAVAGDFGIYYGHGYVSRLTTGQPKSKYWAYYYEPWAWSPKVVTGADPVTGIMPDYDPDIYDAEKATGNISQLRAATSTEAEQKEADWKTATESITGVDFPSFERSFGGGVDDDFNRGTITEARTSMYGEQLKSSQSTYTPLTAYLQIRALNANYDIGFTANMNSVDNQNTFASWQYLTEWNNWRGFPSQDIIDVSHRAGVGVMGMLWIARGDYAKAKGMMMNPGPDGDFPYAKGLVEIADYYGFDGWLINWEEPDSNDATEFQQFLTRYANAETNYTPLLSPGDVGYVDNRTDMQKEFGYYHRKQSITIYTGMHIEDRRNVYSDDVNRHDNVQRHGADANVATHSAWIDEAYDWGHDAYFPNAAYSPGEKGLSNARSVAGQHYNASQETYKDNFPNSDYAQYNSNDTSTYLENRLGMWIYIYNFGDSIEEDERHFSSFSGDPRIIDPLENWSMSNSYQEKTTIIGRDAWATTFDYGSGKEWHFMGSEDLVASVHGADTNEGWKNHEQQSSLPTYRWIIDEYDASGNILNDPDQAGGLSVDGSGQVIRKTSVNIDNTSTAYHGGTSLVYGGELAAGESIDNKLYASALHVEDGDTFTVKYSKEAYDAGQIDVNLAAWVIDNHMKLPTSDVTGTPANNEWIATTDDLGQDLEDRQGGQYWEYQKEEYWDTSSVKQVVKPASVNQIGETQWVEATYDLSALDDKTIRAFGTNIVAKSDTDLSKLRLGAMNFNPHDFELKQFTIENPEITGIWETDNGNSQAMRIKWDDNSPDYYEDNKLRHYYTFYADSEWNITSLAWSGGQSAAYLEALPASVTNQNIVIIGFDEQYNVASQKSIALDWGGQ